MLRSTAAEEGLLRSRYWPLVAVLILLTWSTSVGADCGDSGVALQILGSAGPFGAGSASAGYILWIDGVSRVMVDAGGGTFARFGEAGATTADLQLLALSHFHPDHAAEVPALLWPLGGSFKVSGPSGSAGFPSVTDFLTGLFGADGVFRVLRERVSLETVQVDVTSTDPMDILTEGDIRVRGLGVPHGPIPAVGYRIDVEDASIAFASDQNGSNPAWTELIQGVDLLVAHFAVSESSPDTPDAFHARPSTWGRMASDAEVGTLVLSHLSAREAATPGPRNIEDNLRDLRSRYDGPVVVAEDLLCVSVGD